MYTILAIICAFDCSHSLIIIIIIIIINTHLILSIRIHFGLSKVNTILFNNNEEEKAVFVSQKGLQKVIMFFFFLACFLSSPFIKSVQFQSHIHGKQNGLFQEARKIECSKEKRRQNEEKNSPLKGYYTGSINGC